MQTLKIAVRCLTALALALTLMPATTASAEDTVGAQPVLRMGVGARALAMGGAFVAVVDDASAAYWNPAALTRVEHIDIVGMYSTGMELDRTVNYISYSQKFFNLAMGLSWLNAGVTDVELYDEVGNPMGTDDWSSNVFTASAGMELEALSIGASAKLMKHDNLGESDTGVGLDVGVLLQPTEMLSLGAVVQDLGSELGDDPIPTNIRVGVAVMPLGEPNLILAADVEKTEDVSDPMFHLGAEFMADVQEDVQLALRAGMDDEAFAAGAGFRFETVRLDYAYVTEYKTDVSSFLGQSHRFSLGFSF